MPQRQVEAIASTLEGVQAGMNPDQVQAILGEPEAVAHAPGTQCSYYAVLLLHGAEGLPEPRAVERLEPQ
ncbi:MAG: hypothetical protein EBY18_19875 [Alphaproteobacteria bacterium]|nr:hypothetical protein [Alphaproteobacteria bacterium]